MVERFLARELHQRWATKFESNSKRKSVWQLEKRTDSEKVLNAVTNFLFWPQSICNVTNWLLQWILAEVPCTLAITIPAVIKSPFPSKYLWVTFSSHLHVTPQFRTVSGRCSWQIGFNWTWRYPMNYNLTHYINVSTTWFNYVVDGSTSWVG